MRKTLLATAASIMLLSGSAFAADLKFAPGQDTKFNWKSYEDFKTAHADLKGQTLTIFGPWRGEDEALFQTVLAYFADATGVNVRLLLVGKLRAADRHRYAGWFATNIAILPQPGLLADLAAKGFLVPLGDDTAKWVEENYGAGKSWVDLGSYKGKDGNKAYFAFPFKADVKSLVWYVPENFEEAGYKVPESMEDCFKLTDQIVADGGTPWCIGLGSGGARLAGHRLGGRPDVAHAATRRLPEMDDE